MKNLSKKFNLSPMGIIALCVLSIILVGTFLLCLPVSSYAGEWTNFITALFTATSATCVTGLTVVNVAQYYSPFGQAVTLLLIQVGGLGFITILSLFTLYLKKSVSLSERKLAMQSAGGLNFGEIKSQLKYIFIGTFAFELLGAILLSVAFIPRMGWGLGVWNAVFTSVSAFCNAGFTLTEAFGDSNLCFYAQDWLVGLTVCGLILIGGIGFFVWHDVKKHKWRLRRYSLHAKTALITTAILTLLGWLLFALFEWNNPQTIGNFSVGGKLISSLFMSVTPRTAGFATVNYANLTQGSSILTIVYMFIGGSPGSTAGGIKTTTLAVLIIAAIATARRKEETVAFGKRYDGEVVFQASAIIVLYVTATLIGVICLCFAEPQASLTAIVTEVVSALCTVGLSANLTPELTVFSQIVICLLMFFGRVGGYTFILIFSSQRKAVKIIHPKEDVMVG